VSQLLSESTVVFPNNIVSLLVDELGVIDPSDTTIKKRPLRATDPNQSIGIFSTMWTPNDESLEMGHRNPHEPTLGRYNVGVQGLVSHGDEEIGLAVHAILANMIRSILYRSSTIAVELPQLVVTDGLNTERPMRWGVNQQRYINNEIGGTFIFLSTLEFWVETVVQ